MASEAWNIEVITLLMHYWKCQGLSNWQLSISLVTIILSKWSHFVFSEWPNFLTDTWWHAKIVQKYLGAISISRCCFTSIGIPMIRMKMISQPSYLYNGDLQLGTHCLYRAEPLAKYTVLTGIIHAYMWRNYYKYCICFNSKLSPMCTSLYGSGHGTVAVLLPGFAINW